MKCTIAQLEQFKDGPIWADMCEVMGRMNADLLVSQAAIPGDGDDLDKVTIDNLLNKGRLDTMNKMAVLPDLCIEEIESEFAEEKEERHERRDG